MYNQITANKRKTVVLIFFFIAFVIGIGYLIGYVSGYGMPAVAVAAVISSIMAVSSYYTGDKVALSMSGARPVTEADNPYLWRMVENLCIASGTPMPKVHIMPDMAINAFATGRNPQRASIAVTQGALEKLENEELEGVLAHELSHIKNYDIRVMTIVVVLVGVVAILADLVLRMTMFGGENRNRQTHPLVLIAAVVAILLAPIGAQMIQFAVSRKREFLADASGALLTRYPEGLARALEKIGSDSMPMRKASEATAHLFFSNPFGRTQQWMAKLFSTHPPIEERVRALRSMA